MTINPENLGPTAEDIAKLETYKTDLARHDWTFYFSDDAGVYRAGQRESDRLLHIAKNNSIEFKQAYNEAHKEQFDRPCFTGETEPNKYPWRPPFPEADAARGIKEETESQGI